MGNKTHFISQSLYSPLTPVIQLPTKTSKNIKIIEKYFKINFDRS